MLSWIALVPTILSSITGIINRVVPDVNEQAKIAAEIQTALIAKSAEAEKAIAEAAKAQNEVNLAEAQSPSLFVAGWRPFVGWTCGFGTLTVTFTLICTSSSLPRPESENS